MLVVNQKVPVVKILLRLGRTTPWVTAEVSPCVQGPGQGTGKEPLMAAGSSAMMQDPKVLLDPILAALVGLQDSQFNILDKLVQIDKEQISLPAVLPVDTPQSFGMEYSLAAPSL